MIRPRSIRDANAYAYVVVERRALQTLEIRADAEDELVGGGHHVGHERGVGAAVAVGLRARYEPARLALYDVQCDVNAGGGRSARDVEHVRRQRQRGAPSSIQRPTSARSAPVMPVTLPSGIAWLATACSRMRPAAATIRSGVSSMTPKGADA